MDAQDFNSAPKFSDNGGFHTQVLHFWTNYIPRGTKFNDNFHIPPKFIGGGEGQLPPSSFATTACPGPQTSLCRPQIYAYGPVYDSACTFV